MCVSFRFRIHGSNSRAVPMVNGWLTAGTHRLQGSWRMPNEEKERAAYSFESPVVDLHLRLSRNFFFRKTGTIQSLYMGEFTLGSFTYIFSRVLVVSHDALQRCFALFTTQVFGQKWCKAAMQQEKRLAMRLHVLFC